MNQRADDLVLIDKMCPRRGPCLICGVPGVDQRYRLLDAISDRLRAGEDPELTVEDYKMPLNVVEAIGRSWRSGSDT